MYVCHLCVVGTWRPGLGMGFPEAGVMGSCKLYKVGPELPSSRRTGSIPSDGTTGMNHYI